MKGDGVLLKFRSEIVTSWASRSMSQPIISSWRPDLSFSAAIDSGSNKVRTSSSTLLISFTYVRLLEHAFRSSTYQIPALSMVCSVMTSSVRHMMTSSVFCDDINAPDRIEGIWGPDPTEVTTRADSREAARQSQREQTRLRRMEAKQCEGPFQVLCSQHDLIFALCPLPPSLITAVP